MKYQIFDPVANQLQDEQVYGEGFLKFLYPQKNRPKLIDDFIFLPIAKLPLSSYLYGFLQKLSSSQKKIIPFIQKYKIKPQEFLEKPETFKSFNDFFIRKLKPEARPIDKSLTSMIKPADGRYLLYDDFDRNGFLDLKGSKLNLNELLDIKELPWSGKTCVCIIRLAPVDYHRFHFPVDAEFFLTRMIKGPLFSVNPIAIKKNCAYLSQNKRSITKFDHEVYKQVFMVEIGATHVGSIVQTGSYPVKKGEEKGYFEFGGSCVVLVFENLGFKLDETILSYTKKGIETLGKMGEKLTDF